MLSLSSNRKRLRTIAPHLAQPDLKTLRLKQAHLDVQELLRILPEIANQQPHIPGQTGQVVVQLRIGKKFSRGSGVVVQLRGSRRQIRAGIAQLVVQLVVRDQFAQRSLSARTSPIIALPFSMRLLGLDRKASGSFSSFPIVPFPARTSATFRSRCPDFRVHLAVHLVGSHQFSQRAVPLLNVAVPSAFGFGQQAVQMVVAPDRSPVFPAFPCPL